MATELVSHYDAVIPMCYFADEFTDVAPTLTCTGELCLDLTQPYIAFVGRIVSSKGKCSCVAVANDVHRAIRFHCCGVNVPGHSSYYHRPRGNDGNGLARSYRLSLSDAVMLFERCEAGAFP